MVAGSVRLLMQSAEVSLPGFRAVRHFRSLYVCLFKLLDFAAEEHRVALPPVELLAGAL